MGEMKYPQDLGKFIDLMRKKGVRSFKISGIEMELLPEAPPSNYKKKEDSKDEIKVEDAYTEEDALFWSSAGVPELKEGNG
jgi:hypothetical protein